MLTFGLRRNVFRYQHRPASPTRLSEQAWQHIDQEIDSGRGRIGATSGRDGSQISTAGGDIAGTGDRLHEAAEVLGDVIVAEKAAARTASTGGVRRSDSPAAKSCQ
jgi:hypothetical protein